MASEPEKKGSLPIEVDTAVRVDARLADVWGFLWEVEQAPEAVSEDTLAGLLRLAYLTGYQDALIEPQRGSLFTEVGLPVPPRISPMTPASPRGSRRARRDSSGR